MFKVGEVITSLALVLALGVATADASPPYPGLSDTDPIPCAPDVDEDGYVDVYRVRVAEDSARRCME